MAYQTLPLFYRSKVSGKAVCFLHAFPLHGGMWNGQLDFLSSRGITVVAPDYPGFGASAPFPFVPGIEHYAHTVHQLLQDLGIQQVVLVGLSMGGYVALAYLRHYPQQVAGLVLANTRTGADTEAARQRRYQLIQQLEQSQQLDELIAFHLEKFFTAPFIRQERKVVEEVRRMMEEASLIGVIHALQAMASRPDSTETLANYAGPVLWITGQEDPLIPLSEVQETMSRLKRPVRLEVFSDCAHLANLEKGEAFNRLLLEFVQSLV